MVTAIEKAGYKAGVDFMLAIDAACSDWFDAEDECYHLPKRGIVMTPGNGGHVRRICGEVSDHLH
jgi:enolase